MHIKHCLLPLLILPFFSFAQSGRADDSLRSIADTMHFASPFVFTSSVSSQLSGAELFNKCADWSQGIKDSLGAVTIKKNAKGRKITISNVPATPDISCTVSIIVKKHGYACSLTDYMFHPINGGRMPVDKAAAVRSLQPNVNIEKLLATRGYPGIFASLQAFIKMPG